MRLTQLATLLSLGAGSLSILIPSTTSLDTENVKITQEIKTDRLTPEEYAITQLTQTLEVACDSCPFYTGKDTYSSTPNNLLLTLSLDPDARDTISLNGAPLFPFIYTQDAAEPFTATQKSTESGKEAKVPVGLDLFIETDEHGLSRLRLHVLSVAGFKTHATMDILEFPVFQNSQGEIFIGEVHVRAPTAAEASAVMCKDNMLCRWKAYLYDTIHKIAGTSSHGNNGVRKGCHGKKYKRPPHSTAHEQPHVHNGHKGGEHHKEHHEHQWRWFNWVGLIVRFIIALLIIAAIISTVGLLFTIFLTSVCHILLVVYWLVTGKYKTIMQRHQQRVDEEEQSLMTKDEESLADAPQYTDDLPTYVETEEKQ